MGLVPLMRTVFYSSINYRTGTRHLSRVGATTQCPGIIENYVLFKHDLDTVVGKCPLADGVSKHDLTCLGSQAAEKGLRVASLVESVSSPAMIARNLKNRNNRTKCAPRVSLSVSRLSCNELCADPSGGSSAHRVLGILVSSVIPP